MKINRETGLVSFRWEKFKLQFYWPEIRLGNGDAWIKANNVLILRLEHKCFGIQIFGFGFGFGV